MVNGLVSTNEAPPLICGSFTDWKYKKMISLDNFLRVSDKSQIAEFLDQLKEKGICRGEVTDEN